MEESKNYPLPSLGHRITYTLLFILAAFFWISALTYLAIAYKSDILPISWGVFGVALFNIHIFLIPALILSFPRDPFSPRRIFLIFALIVTCVYWIFSPMYEYLALYETSRAGIRLLAFNYIWLAPLIGFFLSLFFYRRFCRIVRSFPSTIAADPSQHENVRRRLIRFPIEAAIGLFTFAILADIIGLPIARVQLLVPWREIAKELVNIHTIGLLGSVLMFFVLVHILQPWLERLPKADPPHPR